MPFKSISGSRIIGQGQPQAVPIQLDPAPYKGAIAYGSDGLIYVSNGTAWNAVGSGIQGTTGIQGDDGIQGLQGTYGPQVLTLLVLYQMLTQVAIHKQLLILHFLVSQLVKRLLMRLMMNFGYMMELTG